MDTITIHYNNNSPLKSKVMSYQPVILFNKHLYSIYSVKATMLSILQIFTHFLWLSWDFHSTNLYCVYMFTEDTKRSKTWCLLSRCFNLCSWDKTHAKLKKDLIYDNKYKGYYSEKVEKLSLSKESA